MKSAAIGIVRNAVDLAPLTALHQWLLGVDRLWIIDNGSTDGTFEALKRLEAQLPGFRVDRDDGPFDQVRMTNDMANALLRDGFRTIIPFDADECWNLSPRAIPRLCRDRDANVLQVPVVNYVQSRAVLQPDARSWRHATRRVPHPISPLTHISNVVGTKQISFVEKAFPSKVIICPPPGTEVSFVKGNHRVAFAGLKLAKVRTMCCLHLPLRAASELEKRVRDYKDRHKPFRLTPNGGWRLDYWAEMLANGEIGQEWAANSYDEHGMLDVHGQRRPTIVDRRLVRHLGRAERFLAALELTRGTWLVPLRMAFLARPSRFKVPKTVKGMSGVHSA